MKNTSAILLAAICCLLASRLWSEPTEVRPWKSTAGTTIEASATKVENGQVRLKTGNERELTVAMEKLSEDDRVFLKEHFAIKDPEPGQATASTVALVEGGLTYPVGEVSGPIDAGGGSHYFVYVPKTLRQGRKASLMFHTGAGGGSARAAKMYAEGAEVAGWIIASSVESKNKGDHPVGNHEHSKRCVAHLLAHLPIDERRVYFTGNSGGGAMSFYNALRIESMGNMPLIGYSPDNKYPKGQYCYGIGGTRDFNRYLTANAVSQYKDRGMHRLHPGGHDGGPAWIGAEGIVWLSGRYLGDNRNDTKLGDERLDYEASVISWVKALRGKEAYRAHYWCTFLKDEYKISGVNAAPVTLLLGQLNEDPMNGRYTAGIAAIDEFSEEFYAPEGGAGKGSAKKHTTPKIQSAAKNLAAAYAGVPLIEEIAKDLGSPSG